MAVKAGKIKGGARFVRFYPSDWRSGCIGLTLEQEGLYVRVCAFIYETARRLPADDCQAAKFMGIHTNAYRKIRTQLVELGKLQWAGDGWSVPRAERELKLAIGHGVDADQEGREDGSADQDTGRETRPDTLGDTPHNTPIDTPHNTGVVFSKSANENNGHLIEPIANSQKPISPKAPVNFATMFMPVDENGGMVITEGGAIRLSAEQREFWLAEFEADAKRLDLALLQVTVQRSSREPLIAQVNRQLARVVADKLDKDKRYRDAVAANSASKAAPKQIKPSRWGC